MLKEAKDLQETAISSIKRLLDSKKEITFKAPTGTGKTYMMASLMDRVLASDPNVVFLVSTLSKGELASQNYDNFMLYKSNGSFPHLNPYLINTEAAPEERLHIPETYNVYVLPRDLYKQNGKLMKGPMDAFLRELTDPAMLGGQQKLIYLVKDECHQKTNNLDGISKKFFTKVINMSATPKMQRGQAPDVCIKEKDAVDARLIKHVEWGGDADTLDDAIKKYMAIKQDYIEMLGVNPCLIIQISNKDKADEEWNNIIKPSLDRNEVQWVYIVDKEKDCKTNSYLAKSPVRLWKKYVKERLSEVEVIIFKLAISEGWDIPRACMLYQIRDTQSKQLDEQVLGRVRRNPRLLDFETLDNVAQSLATTAWAWGIKPSDGIQYIQVERKTPNDFDANFLIRTTRLKSLKSKGAVDVDKIIKSHKSVPTSIFDLYRKYAGLNESIKMLANDYINTYDDWMNFVKASDEVKKEYNAKICDYNKSMELTKDEFGNVKLTSIPQMSLYEDTTAYITISNNVWQRNDGIDSFAFDSDAEKDWAEILKDFSRDYIDTDTSSLLELYLWGKNYLENSEIKYEYYLDGVHNSYPDFIMKDKHGIVHLFEVKSLNGSSSGQVFDAEEYKQKIEELSKCYTQASKLTEHVFYLPLKTGYQWQIRRFKDGKEDLISKEQFRDSLK